MRGTRRSSGSPTQATRPGNQQLVLGDLPALHPRHGHLARRLLRRDREHRREPPRAPLLRLPDPLELSATGPNQEPDWIAKSGGDSLPLRARDGRRDLRRRSPAVAEQPVQPEPLRSLHGTVPGWCRAHRLLRPRPRERSALQLEPREEPARQGRARDGVHGDRAASSGATPTGSYDEIHRRNAFMPLRAASRRRRYTEYGLPGGFFTVGTDRARPATCCGGRSTVRPSAAPSEQ